MVDAQLWRQAGGASMANLIGDRWVPVPKQNAVDFKYLEQLTDIKKFGGTSCSSRTTR